MKSLKQILSQISIYVLAIICVVVGWYSNEIYSSINNSPISYRTDKEISYAIDERGRLHVIDLLTEKTIIFSDSVALGIQAQVASRIYQDYIKKSK